MMKKRDFAGFVILAALAACAGGGGGGTAIAPNSTQTTAPASNASAGIAPASFTITIPKTSTSSVRRSPAFIPANTQAITMTLLQSNGTNISAAAQTVQGPFALVTGAPGCTSGATALTCTFTINAPLGGDIFVAQTYSTTTAAPGTLIGSGAVALTVADNVRNAASISLNGPVVSVKLFADTSNFYTQTTSMAPRSARIFVIALDVQNNVIINPSTYDTPIFLSLDLSQFTVIGGVTLSGTYAYGQAPMSITGQTGSLPVYSPSDLITFTINAPPPNLLGQVKIVASVGGSSQNPPLVLGIASPTPSPSPPAPPVTPPPTPAPTPSPTMTPTPTPTPTPPGIGYVDTDGSPGFSDGGYATSTNTTTSMFELGAPAPAPGSMSISVMERIAYSGTVTLSSAGCAGNVMVAAGAADFTNAPQTVTYSGPIVLTLTPTSTSASSSCVVTATDGTQTALLDVDVNSLNLTISARRKK